MNIIKRFLSVAAVALMCWGCETGFYNENYLDGYENNGEITDVRNIELTLDADHYAAIAKNSDNKAIAQEDGEQTVAALNAISKNHYFATADDAATYLPAYLDALYPTFDNGSVAMDVDLTKYSLGTHTVTIVFEGNVGKHIKGGTWNKTINLT